MNFQNQVLVQDDFNAPWIRHSNLNSLTIFACMLFKPLSHTDQNKTHFPHTHTQKNVRVLPKTEENNVNGKLVRVLHTVLKPL